MTLVFPKTCPFTVIFLCKSCLNFLKALTHLTFVDQPSLPSLLLSLMRILSWVLSEIFLEKIYAPLCPCPCSSFLLISSLPPTQVFLFLPHTNKWRNHFRIIFFISRTSLSQLPNLHHQLPGLKCSGSIHIRYT